MTSFWQEGRVCLLNGFFNRGRLNGTMVYKEKECQFLCMVIGVADVAIGLETPSFIFHFKGNELVRDGAAMNNPDPIDSSRSWVDTDAHRRITMFLA